MPYRGREVPGEERLQLRHCRTQSGRHAGNWGLGQCLLTGGGVTVEIAVPELLQGGDLTRDDVERDAQQSGSMLLHVGGRNGVSEVFEMPTCSSPPCSGAGGDELLAVAAVGGKGAGYEVLHRTRQCGCCSPPTGAEMTPPRTSGLALAPRGCQGARRVYGVRCAGSSGHAGTVGMVRMRKAAVEVEKVG